MVEDKPTAKPGHEDGVEDVQARGVGRRRGSASGAGRRGGGRRGRGQRGRGVEEAGVDEAAMEEVWRRSARRRTATVRGAGRRGIRWRRRRIWAQLHKFTILVNVVP